MTNLKKNIYIIAIVALIILNLFAFLSYCSVFRQAFEISGFTHEIGHCYTYTGYPFYQHFGWYKFNFNYKLLSFFIRSDNMSNNYRSKLVVYENGKPLGPPHILHQDIRKLGKGKYSHWRNSIFLSSSDNSDPNSNNRIYTIKYPLSVPLPILIILLLMLAIPQLPYFKFIKE